MIWCYLSDLIELRQVLFKALIANFMSSFLYNLHYAHNSIPINSYQAVSALTLFPGRYLADLRKKISRESISPSTLAHNWDCHFSSYVIDMYRYV